MLKVGARVRLLNGPLQRLIGDLELGSTGVVIGRVRANVFDRPPKDSFLIQWDNGPPNTWCTPGHDGSELEVLPRSERATIGIPSERSGS